MTREEILAMQPGRELDSWIATDVIGLKNLRQTVDDPLGIHYPPSVTGEWSLYRVPLYSTSIAAAWEVVGMMQDQSRRIVLSNYLDGAWAVSVRDGGGGYVVGEEVFNSAPEAICKAALMVVIEL